jgi:hypothetical protein
LAHDDTSLGFAAKGREIVGRPDNKSSKGERLAMAVTGDDSSVSRDCLYCTHPSVAVGIVLQREIVKIIAACDQIGRSSYERRRARAMTLLMRYAGLRISDVVTLARAHPR